VKITIVAVGKLKEKYWKEALAEYLRRLSAYAKLSEIELSDRGSHTGSPEEIARLEGEDILAKLQQIGARTGDAFIFALDGSRGKELSSEALSKQLDDLQLRGKSKLIFIIGGSHGLSPEVLDSVQGLLSLGKQTWPHNMARVMLAEQLYRAKTISHNYPYHK
jgi:23S rRNA (pseudouridine1915-N3)-methyltransferase